MDTDGRPAGSVFIRDIRGDPPARDETRRPRRRLLHCPAMARTAAAAAATTAVTGRRRRRPWPRRLLRAAAWATKALLAAVALAALVAWPWSYGHSGTAIAWRWAAGSEKVDRWIWFIGWADGRVGAGSSFYTFSGEVLQKATARSAFDDAGWNREYSPDMADWSGLEGGAGFGPVHWLWRERAHASWLPDIVYRAHALYLPCWLLALAAGAWPAGSAALFVRRRRRLRRLARDGCCRRCGYDCRATPDPAGPRLPACPECGAAAAAAAE
jgi:hypothetical protein